MRREELAHILRAAAEVAQDGDILVIGSQAVLATAPESALPPAATMSIEADVAFLDDPDTSKADRVDGAIGEGSEFHRTFGYYAQGVETTTAVLPDGWEERVLPFDFGDVGRATAVCLEVHDLVAAKLVAGRPKDAAFARALVAVGLVSVDVLIDRIGGLPVTIRRRVFRTVERLQRDS